MNKSESSRLINQFRKFEIKVTSPANSLELFFVEIRYGNSWPWFQSKKSSTEGFH